MNIRTFIFLLGITAGSVPLAIGATGAMGGGPSPEVKMIGTGSYTTVLPPGVPGVPSKIYKTDQVTGKLPANQWWSSLAWEPFSSPQYPHPLSVKALPAGLQIHYPRRILANATGIYGRLPETEAADFILGHSEVAEFPEAFVDSFSDWFVTALFETASKGFRVTYGHGSPFVYAEYYGGEPRLIFPGANGKPLLPKIWFGSPDEAVLGITINGKHYGLFGPSGSNWSGVGAGFLTNHGHGKNYFAIACLPERSAAALNKFRKYAYSHVKKTKVHWRYNPETSEVTTTFTYETTAYEGNRTGVIWAMYPHQWRNTRHRLLKYRYHSVRGIMKTAEGDSFETIMKYPGILPGLPDTGTYDRNELAAHIARDETETGPVKPDTYWYGKYLGKLAALIPIAEQAGDPTTAARLRARIKACLEDWFTAKNSQGQLKSSQVFYYHEPWGTLIGYPASYGSDLELNDHHFHYGYFIRAAAEIARRDRDWASESRWGGMVKLLIRDIANPERGHPLFPFMRNFDVYAGHSWAAGHGKFPDGNNQESSSEAMNAWTGMILWGEATGDRPLRDLGIYLYTTEMNAIHQYWFDSRRQNHPSGYTPTVATLIWGGKGVYATWWSSNPEEKHGINWLPFHGGSLYLGRYPEYVARDYQALLKEKAGTHRDQWEDLIWMWLALSDPSEALRRFNLRARDFTPEEGNSRAFTYHWLHNLNALGHVDQSITADYPLYAVFNQNGHKTYAVYNITGEPVLVGFSDGRQLLAAPNQFTISK
jgi:endoglucanase Acf2